MRVLLIITLLSGVAVSQDHPSALEPDYTTACSDPDYKAACKSYNELVSSKDPDLIKLLSNPDSYVCFREKEDVFNVIAVNTPRSSQFKKLPQGMMYQVGPASFIAYHRFKNGQDDHMLFLVGKWSKFGPDGAPIFETSSKETPSLEVTDSEISLFEDFKNVGGGKTIYTFRLRRSTMRATETFQWDNPAPDAKSKPDRGEDTDSGHCISFNSPTSS